MPEKPDEKKITYLREVEIKYKKRTKKSKSTVGQSLSGTQQVVEFFSDFQNETKEKLIAVSLDAKNKILCFEIVAIGSLTTIYIRPIEALRASILVNAFSVIFVHNHPSGDPKPSSADKEFTVKMQRYDDLGIVLLDHIIIGENCYYSFCEDGKL